MRMHQGTIYLVRPMFGRHKLPGPAVIGPTWIEYTLDQESDGTDSGETCLPEERRSRQRLLIPLTNVAAISIDDDANEGE